MTMIFPGLEISRPFFHLFSTEKKREISKPGKNRCLESSSNIFFPLVVDYFLILINICGFEFEVFIGVSIECLALVRIVNSKVSIILSSDLQYHISWIYFTDQFWPSCKPWNASRGNFAAFVIHHLCVEKPQKQMKNLKEFCIFI